MDITKLNNADLEYLKTAIEEEWEKRKLYIDNYSIPDDMLCDLVAKYDKMLKSINLPALIQANVKFHILCYTYSEPKVNWYIDGVYVYGDLPDFVQEAIEEKKKDVEAYTTLENKIIKEYKISKEALHKLITIDEGN